MSEGAGACDSVTHASCGVWWAIDCFLGTDIAREIRQAKLEQKKAKRKDYYKIMQLPKTAQLPEIKKAFRKLSLQHHPDRVTEPEAKKKAEVIFKDITEGKPLSASARL